MLKKKDSAMFFGGCLLQYQYSFSKQVNFRCLLPLMISIEESRTVEVEQDALANDFFFVMWEEIWWLEPCTDWYAEFWLSLSGAILEKEAAGFWVDDRDLDIGK